MNSTNMPDNFLTQSLNGEEHSQEGWHYSAAQYHNTFMVEPHADRMAYQISPGYLHSAPIWLPFWCLHHYGQFVSQGIVYLPAYPYYGYQTSLQTSHEVVDPTSFHYNHQTLHQPNFAPDQGINGVSMAPSFVEIPPLPATHNGGLDLPYNLSTSAQVPAYLTHHDLQRIGYRQLAFPVPHPSLPEVTSPEDISEIYQHPVEPVEFRDACTDTGSMRFHPQAMENHSSQHVYQEACTEHFPERAEFCNGPVSATEAAPTINFFNGMDNYGGLCQANPDFHDFHNNWSGSVDPMFPEVTSLEDNTSFFQSEPEIYQPPVDPVEFEEASVDLRSMGFHHWATQDHYSDSVDTVASRVECGNGLVLTTEAASSHYDPLCLTNPDFQDLYNWSVSGDPMFPEVTSLENAMTFFQCEPEADLSETYLPPAQPEFIGSMRFHPLHTQEHSSVHEDSMDYKEHFPERAEFCDGPVSTTEAVSTQYDQPCLAKTDLKDVWSDLLEDNTEFFQCEPETEISTIHPPPVEAEFGEACADTGSMRVHHTMTEDHFSDFEDLGDCTEHFQEQEEFCNGLVSTPEAASTYYDPLCHTNPDFQDLNNWSDLLEPTCPEVTSLEDTTEFFQCEPETEILDIHQLPVEAEFGEDSADTGSMRVHHTVTQDHFSDYEDLGDCTEHVQEQAEFCDGLLSTTQAAKTFNSQLCLTNPDIQDHNNEAPLKDTMSLIEISRPPVEESEPIQRQGRESPTETEKDFSLDCVTL